MQNSGFEPLIPILILFFVIPFVLLAISLKVIAMWKICTRAGFSGPLGLLMLVPFGDIILPLYVAFARWPDCKKEPKQGAPAD
ncbi:MAG: hypothetical protein JW793_14340 [Acidobacteria bacterium]|nr:hypothetical protein [Acidobacteriota bacterium]